MEDENEKITALRKAYAEIILNTTKEAAVRIMVSERKAQKYQHDLSTTKDEALRLLLRLKQTMDSKVNEVEMKSRDQQLKIEELEAQLYEAEDIVSSLRAELNDAHLKLDEFASNQMCSEPHAMSKPGYENVISQPDRINNGAHGDSSANNSLEESCCSGEPEVPSIISRRKEPKLYRNGCTQRIHACDENLLKGHLKNVKALREDNEGEKIFVETPVVADGECVEEEKSVDIEEIEDDEHIMQVLKLLGNKRKRASKFKRNIGFLLERVCPVAKEACCHDMHESDNKLTEVVNEDREVANLDALGSNTELEMKNTLNLDVKPLETSDELSSPQTKDRVLKYTFQRKRKKESVVSDDSSFLHEENPIMKTGAKKQNGHIESGISNEVTESLRDGRRMAQVAHQLVSLSEKKWIK